MSVEHVFVDTNILLYAYDLDAGLKHERAKRCVEELFAGPYPPALSVQVLQEFTVNLLERVELGRVEEIVRPYFSWEIIPNDTALFQAGVELVRRYRLSLRDSFIVAAALRAKAGVLLSEDFQDGQEFGEVVVRNPVVG